jgi:hypothetical protein
MKITPKRTTKATPRDSSRQSAETAQRQMQMETEVAKKRRPEPTAPEKKHDA